MKITDYIKVGKENAISRKTLVALTGLTDRKCRQLIEDERAKGTVICNLQNGKGYFLPETTKDYLAQFNINKSRAMSILVQQKFIYAVLKENKVDVKWNEVAE